MPKTKEQNQLNSNSKHTQWRIGTIIIEILKFLYALFRDFFIWTLSIIIGFAPIVVKVLRACEVAGNYSWDLIYQGVFSDLDIVFSLIATYYALYLQAEQLSSREAEIVKVCRLISVTASFFLLFWWMILSYSPVLQNLLTQYAVTINITLSLLTLIWGLIIHVIFKITG